MICGQESNCTMRRLAKTHMTVLRSRGQIARGDSLHNDRHPDLEADLILADPPCSAPDWGGNRLADDKRGRYGLPPEGNASFAWVQHMVHHRAPRGVAGSVPANGPMSSGQPEEGEIRTNLIGAESVDRMVALPGQLFRSTRIPAGLGILARGRRRVEILFIAARRLGRMVDRTHRDLTGKETVRITDTYYSSLGRPPRQGTATPMFPASAESSRLGEVGRHGHVLMPDRYVGGEPEEVDGEPLEEKMSRLVPELRKQQAVGARLDAEIAEDSKALGFGGRGPPGGVS